MSWWPKCFPFHKWCFWGIIQSKTMVRIFYGDNGEVARSPEHNVNFQQRVCARCGAIQERLVKSE